MSATNLVIAKSNLHGTDVEHARSRAEIIAAEYFGAGVQRMYVALQRLIVFPLQSIETPPLAQ